MEKVITFTNIKDFYDGDVDVTILDKNNADVISGEVYNETKIILYILINSIENEKDSLFYDKIYKAVDAGMLIRIYKFMNSVLALSENDGLAHGEVVQALNRCINETSIKLLYFTRYAKEDDYENFILSGLKAEREILNTFKKSKTQNRKISKIEERQVRIIEKMFRASGINDLEKLDYSLQFKSFKAVLNTIKFDGWYPFVQQSPSNSVHGNWSDLLMNNLFMILITSFFTKM